MPSQFTKAELKTMLEDLLSKVRRIQDKNMILKNELVELKRDLALRKDFLHTIRVFRVDNRKTSATQTGEDIPVVELSEPEPEVD